MTIVITVMIWMYMCFPEGEYTISTFQKISMAPYRTFSQKVCFFTFQNLLRDFFEEKREMSLLGSRSSVRILTMMTFTLTDLANIS